MKKIKKEFVPASFNGSMPVLEFSGNRQVTVEGSTGVLQYDSEVIKINTKFMILAFYGRNLNLKSISPMTVIIEGFITKTEFVI